MTASRTLLTKLRRAMLEDPGTYPYAVRLLMKKSESDLVSFVIAELTGEEICELANSYGIDE